MLARVRMGRYWLTGVIDINLLMNDQFLNHDAREKPGTPESGLLQRSSLDNCFCVERTFHFWISNPERSVTKSSDDFLSDGLNTV